MLNFLILFLSFFNFNQFIYLNINMMLLLIDLCYRIFTIIYLYILKKQNFLCKDCKTFKLRWQLRNRFFLFGVLFLIFCPINSNLNIFLANKRPIFSKLYIHVCFIKQFFWMKLKPNKWIFLSLNSSSEMILNSISYLDKT